MLAPIYRHCPRLEIASARFAEADLAVHAANDRLQRFPAARRQSPDVIRRDLRMYGGWGEPMRR